MSLEKERHTPDEKTTDDQSDAYDFGGENSLPPPPTLNEAQEKRLWRKIDGRLMPILALLYLVSFIDRGIAHFTIFHPYCSPNSTQTQQETSVWFSHVHNCGVEPHNLVKEMRGYKAYRHSFI